MKHTDLEAWMWGDPAAVAERRQLQHLAKIEREAKRRREYEHDLSPRTVLQIRRMRIRELVANAKGER